MANRMGRAMSPHRLHRVARLTVEEQAAAERAALDIDPDEMDPTMVRVPATAPVTIEGVTLNGEPLTFHPTIDHEDHTP